ncbi:MAG: molybdopterin-dependent oxidoreductase [Hyphomicrobiales bacterium]|nr:molybdopterin-dependent oxidoreductase [Hyphomicrobiales bacterium]
MDDLKRFPSVTRLHFIECAGNRHTPKQETVQETHGMTSCAEWTGVLLSTLLKECGLKGSAKWFVAEGAEEVKGASSMPITKAMDDCLIAYGMNGEPLRPQNGFPVRLIPPGFEGILHTKYLRRIKVVDQYYMNYNDFGHLRPDPRELALSEQIGPKSVITYPSGGQQLPGRGFYEISGLAWSGGGAIRTVEVSTDGGISRSVRRERSCLPAAAPPRRAPWSSSRRGASPAMAQPASGGWRPSCSRKRPRMFRSGKRSASCRRARPSRRRCGISSIAACRSGTRGLSPPTRSIR